MPAQWLDILRTTKDARLPAAESPLLASPTVEKGKMDRGTDYGVANNQKSYSVRIVDTNNLDACQTKVQLHTSYGAFVLTSRYITHWISRVKTLPSRTNEQFSMPSFDNAAIASLRRLLDSV